MSYPAHLPPTPRHGGARCAAGRPRCGDRRRPSRRVRPASPPPSPDHLGRPGLLPPALRRSSAHALPDERRPRRPDRAASRWSPWCGGPVSGRRSTPTPAGAWSACTRAVSRSVRSNSPVDRPSRRAVGRWCAGDVAALDAGDDDIHEVRNAGRGRDHLAPRVRTRLPGRRLQHPADVRRAGARRRVTGPPRSAEGSEVLAGRKGRPAATVRLGWRMRWGHVDAGATDLGVRTRGVTTAQTPP